MGQPLNRTSLFLNFVDVLANSAERLITTPPDNREALRATARSVFAAALQSAFGGEQLHLYVPKLSAEQRQARDARIGDSAGPADDVAKRERVSDRHVRRVRGRINGG